MKMIATHILIFTVILISSVHFITCPEKEIGVATKPNMKQFAVADNPLDPTKVEEELNQSDLVKTSVPTKIRHVVSKSIGLFVWPFKKSWTFIKEILPSRQNNFIKQTPTKNE